MVFILATLLVLVSWSASAQQSYNPYKYFTTPPSAGNAPQRWKWTIPPEEYDYYYDGLELIIRTVDDLTPECPHMPRATGLGCAKPRGNTCTIILRDDAFIRTLGWTTALVLRHEMAHCNGWKDDHAGLRSYDTKLPVQVIQRPKP